MVLLVVGVLVVVLGATAAFMIQRTASMIEAESVASARIIAGSVADSMQAFGEIGDMDGLELFLENLDKRGDLAAAHAVRSPATVADFGEREGAASANTAEQQVIDSGEALRSVDADAHQVRFVLPLLADQHCLSCHQSAKENDVLGAASVTIRTDAVDAAQASLARTTAGVFFLVVVFAATLLAIGVNRSVIRPVKDIAAGLNEGADQVQDAAAQVSSAAQQLAAGAGDQASSLEETSSALEEMAAVTRANAQNAAKADALATQTRKNAAASDTTVKELNLAVHAISESSSEVSKIIKGIEQIAFQTNLLALNAAVEAARAGEQGKGFAVVAHEVRNLAQRSAQAARDTSDLIGESVKRAEEGATAAEGVGTVLQEIAGNVTQVAEALRDIAQASNEQAEGIEQLNTAVAQMDRVTQQNAASAEESAAAAEQLTAQSRSVKAAVNNLSTVISGSSASAAGDTAPNTVTSTREPR